MPVAIADRSLRNAYRALGRAVTGGRQATLSDLEKLLARVADRSGLAMTKADDQLKNAVSTQEKLAIVREGMSDPEKSALVEILDHGDVPLADDARKFLEQLVGRAPVNQPHGSGPVEITGMRRKNGKVEIEGTSAPNVTVEALNLSIAPRDRLHDDDTFVLGKTDGQGKLSGKTAVRAGDWLRLRTRDAGGKTSDWMVVRADQLGADENNAVIALERLDVTDAGGGKVALANNNNSRPLSEPFAQVQLTNKRTGEKTVLELDDTGRLPGVPKLNGRGGDTFEIAVSDKRNNASFKEVAGTLVAQGGGADTGVLDEPLPHKDDRKPDGSARYNLVEYKGPLFLGAKANYDDVIQGNLGDCYTPAAAAALAFAKPELLPLIIRKPTAVDRKLVNEQRAARGQAALPPDADYTVVEFKQDPDGNEKKWLEAVDSKLYSRSWGGPLYGTSRNSTARDKMELWFPLFEKAWAQFSGTDRKEGNYDKIGNGGASSTIFEAVLGRPALEMDFGPSNKDRCFDLIKHKIAKKLPVCLGTKDDKGHAALFANTGVYGDHTYTVLDAFEKNGVKYVKLRNPWGESEPAGNGKNDGTFVLKLDELPKWYSVLWSVE